MTIFKAQVDTPYGLFTIAVDTDLSFPRTDIYAAAYSELKAPQGMLRIKGDVKKSNRRILDKMSPIKQARTNDKYWGWIKKDK